MACFNPLDGWYAERLNENGKRPITLDIKAALLDRPVQIPCGKCPGCMAEKKLEWAVRAYHESTQHTQNSFLTLTYDDLYYPKDGKVSREEMRRFIRSLRAKTSLPLKYFLCGEYGGKTHRAHYHALIFGADFLSGSYNINDDLYGSPLVDRIWNKGFCSIGKVEVGSCAYVAGYAAKKLEDSDTFTLKSKGLGFGYLDQFKDDMRRTGACVMPDGNTVAIPKAYLAKYPEFFSSVTEERRKFHASKDALAHREGNRSRHINMVARLREQQQTEKL